MSSEIKTRTLDLQEQINLHSAFVQCLGGQTVRTAQWQASSDLETPHEVSAEQIEDGNVTVSIQRGRRTESFLLPSEEQAKMGTVAVVIERIDYGEHDSSSNHDFSVRAHHLGVLALCYRALATELPDSLEQAATAQKLADVAYS